MEEIENGSSNWLERGIEALRRDFPHLRDDASVVGMRLAELVYERAPAEVRARLGDGNGLLRTFGQGEPADASVGYPSFVERGRHAIGCTGWEGTEEEAEDLANRAAGCFLRAAGGAMGPSTRDELSRCLPRDVRSAMFGQGERSK